MCKQNFHKAQSCCKRLYKKGFDVLSVKLGGRRPRIEIAHRPACRKLGGTWFRRRFEGGCHVYRMAANLWGCQVEWEERRLS